MLQPTAQAGRDLFDTCCNSETTFDVKLCDSGLTGASCGTSCAECSIPLGGSLATSHIFSYGCDAAGLMSLILID